MLIYKYRALEVQIRTTSWKIHQMVGSKSNGMSKSNGKIYQTGGSKSRWGGGEGYSGYILVGVFPGTPKKGVVGDDTAPKKGGLRCGTTGKGVVLDTSTTPKRGSL